MTAGSAKRFRMLAPLGWAAVVAAPLLSHLAIATGRFGDMAAVLDLAEVATLSLLALRQVGGWRRVAGGAVAAALLGTVAGRLFWPDALGVSGLMAASATSHALIYGSLLALFGRTLRAGHTDLITGLALRLRGTLTAEMRRYTHNVTIAWCCFFAAQIAASAGLLALAPHRVWSAFVNLLDGPLVVAMFAAEFAIRRWRFRGYPHISPLETFRSFTRDRAGGGR